MNGETCTVLLAPSSINQPVDGRTAERLREEQRLLRKLDIRLRTAITAARLKGLEHDLGLSDLQYNVVLSILFVTLALGQPPSNMVAPSIYIGGCVVAWGLASALSGGFLACRFFIGLPEASFYPGAVYLLSCWYTKKELAIRSAVLFAGVDIANAFGALVAAAILSGMEGTLGIAGWRWLFIIEGCATILLGFLPRNTRWINDKESRLAQARLAEDAGEADQDTAADSPLHGLKLAVADPLVWLFSMMLFSQHLGRSVGQFFPTLAKTLGYSTTHTLLLTAPPWLTAAILCVLSAWHADKTGERFFHISIWIWAMMVGFSSVSAQCCAMTLVWASNSIPRPPAKRAAALGIANGIGNLGTLVGSYAWKSKWGPKYNQSFEISLAALAVSTVFALVIRQRLVWMNRQFDTDNAAASSGTSEERVKKAAHLEGFRYLY
ncbi:major facilitator superfamily domain-containing protein [Mycena olivaceomarginata]|nr:major facilitator superfamily domain-containing protein [Mycena olivaceomarginata]